MQVCLVWLFVMVVSCWWVMGVLALRLLLVPVVMLVCAAQEMGCCCQGVVMLL